MLADTATLLLVYVCQTRPNSLKFVAQAAADGSLGILVDKVHSQPQIFTAYGRDAPIRDRVSTAELKRLVEPLKARHSTCYESAQQMASA